MPDKTTFFKLDRKIFGSDIWLQPVELRIFIYLIGQARFEDEPNRKYERQGVIIEKGQYLKSYRKLQEELEYIENNAVKQYSLSKIKRALDNLKEEKRIETEKTPLGTLFTVVNYCHYQGWYSKKSEHRTEMEQQRNGVGTEMEQQRNNTNKGNNVNNGNKDNNKPSEKSDTESDEFSLNKKDNGRYDYPKDYERLYSLYPYQRGNKKAGWRKWAATRRKNVSQDDLIEAVKNYAAKCKKDGTEEKWVMHIKKFFGPDEYWKEYLGGNDNGGEFQANNQSEEEKLGAEVDDLFNQN